MINVTTEAKGLLHDLLKEARQQVGGAEESQERVIRLAPAAPTVDSSSGQVELGLMLDVPREEDQVVQHEGEDVLHVDQEISEMLDGATIDAVETPDGRRLTISQ